MSAYAFLSSLKLLPVLSYHVGASPFHHGGSPSDGLLLFMDRLSTSCLCGLLCCMACMASSHAHRLVRPWLQSVGSWLPTFDPICWIGRSPDSTRLLIWGCRVWTEFLLLASLSDVLIVGLLLAFWLCCLFRF